MKSVVVSEPVWHEGTVLIDERSDQVKVGDDLFIVNLGAPQPLAFYWKGFRSFAASAGGRIEAVFSDTILHSVGARLAESLSQIPGIERILVRRDDDFFRVWTVIADMDLRIEDEIYAAQLAFMDQFRDIPLDFSVIFRQGKDPETLLPAGAHEIYSAR